MYQKLLHTKGLRLLGGLLGSLLLAAAINVFIVPQGLYGGGAYGLCQVIRTLVLRALDLELPFDLAGVLYFFVNIPLFMLAFRALGREFFLKAAICTAANSLFLAIIPSPAVPGHSGTVSQQKGQPLHRGAVLHHLQRRTVYPVLLPVRRHHRHLLRYI